MSSPHNVSKVQAQVSPTASCANFGAGATVTCMFGVSGGTGTTFSITVPAGFSLVSVMSSACTNGTFAGGVFTCPTNNVTSTTITETILVAGGAAGAALTETVTCLTGTPLGCGGSGTAATIAALCSAGGVPVTSPGGCVGVTHAPTGEQKSCTNTASSVGLSQVIGGGSLSLGTSGFGTSFTLPMFGGASTCTVQLTQNGAPCGSGSATCSDGYVTISLTTPGSSAVISCAGGACQSQTGGTTLQIGCGGTAGFGQPSTNGATCSSVQFEIASMLSGCLGGQTNGQACPLGSNAYTPQGGTATVTISFQSTAINGGINGGIVLGTNSFSLQTPGIGTLLVTATPQLIPSNGTTASVVTATFACGSGFNLTNTGFPLSSFFGGTTSQTNATFAINQPILGGGSAVCGAGLPGTFTFATPGEVLFDNGRPTESVGCGLNGSQSIFGGSSLFNPNNLNPTLPLAFTCTGGAVLAIGAGAAGDAAINVTYASSVGGLTAVGSTLITVAPSSVPRISVACNPSTIASGNTGSLCTATVTDQNGTPLTGAEGATVTWTVSDTTAAQILPCVVNLGVANGASALNITTSPNIIPQIVPNTPCNPASGSIPGQSVTFLNGQTTALLVASSYAHPEVVTVSAVLGALIPPEYACEVSPYIPVGYGAAQFAGSSAPSGFLPGLTGCGAGNPVGFTGLASSLSTAGSTALNGIVTMPNTTSANATVTITGPAAVQVVGAAPTAPLGLLHGCNNIIVTTTAGTPTADIAALVSPADAVTAIWAFNNSTKQWRGAFFSDPAAPVDFNVTGNTGASQLGGGAQAGANGLGQTSSNVANGQQVTEGYFICVNQGAEIVSG